MRKTSTHGEAGAYAPFAQGKGGAAVKLKLANGEARGISYFDIHDFAYHPSSGILLATPRLTVTIAGRNLEGLFDDLLDQRVCEIHERHANDARLPESATFIERIAVDRAG